MADGVPASVETKAIAAVQRLRGARATSGGSAPSDLAEDGLDHARAGFGLRHYERRFAAGFDEPTTKPAVSLVLINKGLLGQRLDAQEADGAIRLIPCQRLLLVRAVTARALRDNEPFDFPLGHSGLAKSLESRERKSFADGQGQVGLRTHDPAKHAQAAELSCDFLDEGDRYDSLLAVTATCRRYAADCHLTKNGGLREFAGGAESCLRLVRALAVETNENWMEANRYITWTTCASTRNSLYAKPHDHHYGRPFLQNLTHTTLP